ncbi:MAG: sigma-54-dependent transcriptional regulator [Candidatus Rokuibacteriota bacterium]
MIIVDDEPAEREPLARLVGQWGYEVEAVGSGEEALPLIETLNPALVIADLVLPGIDGVELLQRIRDTGRSTSVLLITGHATVESAVEAMRRGAYDYLTKPIDVRRLEVVLQRAVEHGSLARAVLLLRQQLHAQRGFGRLIGDSTAMQEVYRWIELSAASTGPVLIYGESGTGKELVAQAIHEHSARASMPLVAMNCAAIPHTLIESELFGHERGAFTGATERRAGCFEISDEGTLFLDEIVEMDVSVQAKLLRVLQEGSFRRVGGKGELQVNIRVIAATNRDPGNAIASGQLREDLYYRLNVFPIPIPPLRERGEDVLLLARAFIEECNRADARRVTGLTTEAEQALAAHPWPGNVRELHNIIQRAVAIAERELIGVHDLPRELSRPAAAPAAPGPTVTATPDADGPVMTLEAMERLLITRALRKAKQNKKQAAELLGISEKTLSNKLARNPPKPPASASG